MLLRHTFLDPMVYGFSLTWSLVYNAIIILIVLAVSFIYVRRMDIFKKISEIHKEA
jgi:low affinity Fe/Cu permease